MGRQVLSQENTIYHQRVVNLEEVEWVNNRYKSEQTHKKMLKNLLRAFTPQLVRDINTEVAIEIKDQIDSSEPITLQKEHIKAIVREVVYNYYSLWFKTINSYIKKVNCNVSVTTSPVTMKRKDDTNTVIVASIAVYFNTEPEPMHIILEWCTGLKHKNLER